MRSRSRARPRRAGRVRTRLGPVGAPTRRAGTRGRRVEDADRRRCRRGVGRRAAAGDPRSHRGRFGRARRLPRPAERAHLWSNHDTAQARRRPSGEQVGRGAHPRPDLIGTSRRAVGAMPTIWRPRLSRDARAVGRPCSLVETGVSATRSRRRPVPTDGPSAARPVAHDGRYTPGTRSCRRSAQATQPTRRCGPRRPPASPRQSRPRRVQEPNARSSDRLRRDGAPAHGRRSRGAHAARRGSYGRRRTGA